MRLLVVEDEITLAKSLKKGLEKEGFAVDILHDGEKAERRIVLYQDDYDLVVLDWMLPTKDGVAVCKSVRSQNITVPIILLTAKADVPDRVEGLDSGADDYLVKPFSLQELVARIRALLRRPKEAKPTILRVRDLTLDSSARKVTWNDEEIKLSVKEFAILEYLMRHPNQVINRNQLLDHLWGFDFNSFSNVVDVHIKNLRKKLRNDVTHILETERGIGYKIAAD